MTHCKDASKRASSIRLYTYLLVASCPLLNAVQQDAYAGLIEQLKTTFDLMKGVWLYEPPRDALARMVQSILASDAHARVVSDAQVASLQRMTQGDRGGIGVMLKQQEAGVVIDQVLTHLSAHQQGIHSGDIITHIDQHQLPQTNGLSVAQDLLEGTVGTSVSVTVVRNHKKLTFELVRVAISPYQAQHERIGEVGIISLGLFDAHSREKLRNALEDLDRKKPCRAYIIDLRDTYGGLLQAALESASLFVPFDAVMARTYEKKKGSTLHKNKSQPVVKGKPPLIILVNEQTASAAELFAITLKEQAGAILIGHTTLGKGSIQSVIEMPPCCTIKLTTGKMTSSKGVVWDTVGIEPDISCAAMPGPLGRMLVGNTLDAILACHPALPSRRILVKALQARLPRPLP